MKRKLIQALAVNIESRALKATGSVQVEEMINKLKELQEQDSKRDTEMIRRDV